MRAWLLLCGLLLASPARAQTSDTIEAFRTACDKGEAWFCRELGLRYVIGRAKDPDPAAKATLYLKAACDGQDALGCYNLGVLYHQGDLIPKDPVWAAFYYERGCTYGDRPSCAAASWMRISAPGKVDRDLPTARTLAEQACSTELPDPWGCHLYGLCLLDGLGGPEDPKLALTTLNTACRAGWEHSCKVAIGARKKAERAGRKN